MKSFSFVCEILITAILVFLVPVFFFSYQQELLLQGYAQYEVIYFTDSIRNTGYISARRYEEFKEKLAVTNHVYEIELSVYETYRNSGEMESFCLGTYTDTILDTLYKERKWYTLHQGDFISVSIKRKDMDLIERMLRMFGLPYTGMEGVPIRYGGMVRDECF